MREGERERDRERGSERGKLNRKSHKTFRNYRIESNIGSKNKYQLSNHYYYSSISSEIHSKTISKR